MSGNYKPADYRAAGEWLDQQIAKSKKGIYVAEIELDPPLAKALLGVNPDNRRMSRANIDRMARDIENGAWQLNGETIIVAVDGHLNDGQNRCTAVIETDKPIKTMMVFGVARESRMTVDQGNARTIGHYLDMENKNNTTALGAAAKNIFQWKTYGELSEAQARRPNKSELLALIEANPDIESSVAFTKSRGLHLGVVGGTSLVAFVHFAITRETPREAADEFVKLLAEGAGLDRNHPILHIRNRLITDRTRLSLNEKAELLFRGWNAYRRGAAFQKSVPIMGGVLPVLEK